MRPPIRLFAAVVVTALPASPALPVPAHHAARIVTTTGWIGDADQPGASYGQSVASAGDVNGDGYDDILVGAPRYDHGETDEGQAFLYLGSATGPSPTPDWTAEGDAPGALFGAAVASAGDVNGDGFADVIVGAPGFVGPQAEAGRALVFLGSASGLAAAPAWIGQGDQAFAEYGASVAAAGDVDGDGYGDILVGVPRHGQGLAGEGKVFVYFGAASGPNAHPGWTASGGQAGAHFGHSLAGIGDVNRDGWDDIVVGAPDEDHGETDEGRIAVFFGSAAGPSASPDWRAESDQAEAHFGASVASAGDVNGDGAPDIVVGAPFYEDHEEDDGHAFVYLGSLSGPEAIPGWVGECHQPFAGFGTSVSGVGDVNGDGFGDLLVGIPRHDEGRILQGAAYLFVGAAAAPLLSYDSTTLGARESALFGTSAAAAGDVNGDGFADLLVGAPQDDDGESGEGRAFVSYGQPACRAPELPVVISGVRSLWPTGHVVLDFTDPNPPSQVTGYDVYRSADPSLDPMAWTRLAEEIGDGDLDTPGLQWRDDDGGGPAPGSAWYYQVTAINGACAAEGPR